MPGVMGRCQAFVFEVLLRSHALAGAHKRAFSRLICLERLKGNGFSMLLETHVFHMAKNIFIIRGGHQLLQRS